MRTVEKALRLIENFDATNPEIGLSAMARLSGLDKSTVQRMLVDLASTGFVEQNPTTRAWRLGAGILRLARLREACFPVSEAIMPILARLAAETGETSHAALRSGRDLGTIGVVESPKANRVYLEPGLILPLHATASGIAYTAFSEPEVRAQLLKRNLKSFADGTPLQPTDLDEKLKAATQTGFGSADQTFERDVIGLAAPIFAANGRPQGAVGVATPSSRMTPDLQRKIVAELFIAARAATEALGGVIPPGYRALMPKGHQA
ncbi:IclR family transcriptional regulator [Tabrizicola sp.]|jgi:DNA-binding IclR family transcriptional regulator|uniref:IclR family transcriptional regulator n=1 Tax=Tabrizicola sp. TaxID=2005166 RepID=UPI001A6376A9|nr:IclR family transcriptional regulator [Tabrizicola sp.]MBL9073751.1 IclR family transcriptional regulator [Tabrizicola sp.]